MKTCIRCGEIKLLVDFYPHFRMADGHLNKCKECTKVDVKNNRKKKAEHYAAYDRQRSQTSHRKANQAKSQRTSRCRYPERHAARQAVHFAIRGGLLVRKPCEVCGVTDRVEAHHDDYSRPLDVRWLCFKHHREVAHGQLVISA